MYNTVIKIDKNTGVDKKKRPVGKNVIPHRTVRNPFLTCI